MQIDVGLIDQSAEGPFNAERAVGFSERSHWPKLQVPSKGVNQDCIYPALAAFTLFYNLMNAL